MAKPFHVYDLVAASLSPNAQYGALQATHIWAKNYLRFFSPKMTFVSLLSSYFMRLFKPMNDANLLDHFRLRIEILRSTY